MKKLTFKVVCTDVDHLEAGIYTASFVPADAKVKTFLKDTFRIEVFTDTFEAEETEEGAPVVVGELYDMTITKEKAKAEDLTEEQAAELAEAKAKKAANDKASKAKKKAEAEADKGATPNV
jgi:membrane protein involved in colicin uptake